MLELKDIKKVYPAGGDNVHALKGVSLQFRENEFVSILGPSGCGKTTMLNIIGGLDKYTSGDLVINGVSTKEYKDRDWDAYRNYSIGFVFQSYNLIPHQTVLQNVELALTLSGVSKKERHERAKNALERVGLGSQLKKRPSEMSGGQMQRVAIARAIVNNPDIILADEPTGALDTETSVQVMDILKDIAKDRLVIMVTHNPDLAERYSTRIVRMLDGEIQSDSAPLTEDELKAYEKETEAKKAAVDKKAKAPKKPSMSWGTSFGLSLKNLFSKKGRTILTSFAGSIGIIGIALIYAVSNGMTTYIDQVQEETLASYPITLEASQVDISTLMRTFLGAGGNDNHDHDKDAVYSQPSIANMVNALSNLDTTENDLKAFKAFLEEEIAKGENEKLKEALNGVLYSYDFDLLVYTKNIDDQIIFSDTQELMMESIRDNMGMDVSTMMSMQEQAGMNMTSMYASSFGTKAVLWEEMLSGVDGELINPLIKDQYDVLYGTWPTAANEVVLVVNSRNEIDDITLYALGLKSKEQIDSIFKASMTGDSVDATQEKYSYADMCKMDFRVVMNADCYSYDAITGTYTDLRDSEAGLKFLYENAFKVKITGIIRPNPDATSHMLQGTLAYTRLLTEYVIEKSKDSDAVAAQLKDKTKDIFTGLPFNENSTKLEDSEKIAYFREYIKGLSPQEQAATYVKIMSIPSKEYLESAVNGAMSQYTLEDMKTMMAQTMATELGMSEDAVATYIEGMSDDDIIELVKKAVTEQVKAQYSMQVQTSLAGYSVVELAGLFNMDKDNYTDEQCVQFYDDVLEFSKSSYSENLVKLGYIDLDNPSRMSLYASSFENKDVLNDIIDKYNEGVDDLKKITYTDYIGLMLSSMTTIINAITYVLIAFVAISLVVSSIMIGVITLISVQERTKEIGILRAIGASKRNVSGMFNAETILIGFASGLLGVLLTYILCIPINAIIQNLTGIKTLSAFLPVSVAAILVAISVILTLFAGIIPSRSAAKKDPVVALRTE